ncbi:DUF3806 domain-containing protein [Asticcacaulis taihuensis]|uniref:DUF3806 domain-containing protein n=1 Tax=Asticcacaulis taihuensis TaxID=260084 RepID=UPI0026EF9746|nr:DUF3806 domain-containing protein [Asticcacaulis taihuensis]
MTVPVPIPLRAEEGERIEAARNWIKGHFVSGPDTQYATLEGKLFIIGAILRNGWVRQDETWKLQALGIGFGDALAQRLLLNWVTIDDEYGCDPALNWPGTSIYSYPITMISKRIERNEQINVQDLFENACSSLKEMAFSGRYI